MDFLAQHWNAISSFMLTWGYFAGLLVGALFIAKAVYDTNSGSAVTLTTKKAPDAQPPKQRVRPVEFWLPTNWGEGLRFRTISSDPRVGDIQAEEIHLRVTAKEKMQNVRFEMKALHRHGTQLETMGQIASAKLQGTVPEGLEETFVVMRRTFWQAPVTYKNVFEGHEVGTHVRVEKDIDFFPDTPSAFKAAVGRYYSIQFAVYHDNGPDTGSFTVEVEANVACPNTRIRMRRDVELR